MGRPTWADLLGQGFISAKQRKLLKRGLDPFSYSLTRSYAPLRVRRKRLYNPKSRRLASAQKAKMRQLRQAIRLSGDRNLPSSQVRPA